jgi:hypothetical protein
MKALRIYGCVAAISLGALLGACGTEYDAGSNAGPASAVSVPTEQSSLTQHACSTDCGSADEPVEGFGVVQCGWAMDDLPEHMVVSSSLVSACDFRLTGEACEEDELCAVAVVRDTGDFPGPGTR